MKFLNIKKLALPLLAAAAVFSSCDKAETTDQLADNGQQIIKIAGYGGIQDPGFGGANLVFDPSSTSEMVSAQLEFSTSQVSSSDITVTVAVDPAGVERYNATVSDPGGHYELLPATAYTFPSTTVIIRAGQILSEPFNIEFNPSMIDPAVNLMLPITITSINGAPSNVRPAPSTGTAYFHFIGNPLAGFYTATGHRTNYAGQVTWDGPPAPEPAGGTNGTTAVYSGTKFAAPLDSHTTQMDMGNIPDASQTGSGGLAQYFITSNADYTDIDYDLGPGFESVNGYTIKVKYHEFTPAGPGTPASYRLVTQYFNGSSGDRIVDQTFVHQ